MYPLDEHMYAVGKLEQITLDPNEAAALGLSSDEAVNSFTRLYKDGVLYHSLAYTHSEGKEITPCAFFVEERKFISDKFSFLLTPATVCVSKADGDK